MIAIHASSLGSSHGESLFLTAETLLVSLLVPVYNEEKYIARCLETLLANQIEGDFEIIVIDGGSTDKSPEIVALIAAKDSRVRQLVNPGRIPPSAMNLGIQNARGRYIVRADAHSEYPSDYLKSCIDELERTGAGNVGGSWVTMPGADTTMARAIAYLTQHPFGVGPSAFRVGWTDRWVDTVPFGAFRREIFQEVGLYREGLRRLEDFELNSRIRAAGKGIYLSSKITNTYFSVPTLGKLAYQAWLTSTWAAMLWMHYPRAFAWRHAVPLMFVLALTGLFIGSFFLEAAVWLLAGTLAAYAICALVSAVSIALRRGFIYLFLLPWMFFFYHLTYGLGAVHGIVRYLINPDSRPMSEEY